MHQNSSKKIKVIDAIYFAASAWRKVTRETIKNCFKKAFRQTDVNGNDGLDVLADVTVPEVFTREEFEAGIELEGEEDDIMEREEYGEAEDDHEPEPEQKADETDLPELMKCMKPFRKHIPTARRS